MIERINNNTNPVLVDRYEIKPESKSKESNDATTALNIDTPDVQSTTEKDSINLLDITDDIDVTSSEINNEMNDPIMIQLTNMIMRDGKKASAQRYVADCCLEIRKQTKNNPYQIIKASIEKTSPLVRLIGYKQNSKNIQIPIPLNERQKRHKAIKWILNASDKRPGKKFSERLALEILAVINGQSPALQQRESVHKAALVNRANLPVKW
ncbi:11661_t:CDS:2 [Diversispora eburnea]|uniref:11661_t:CDS:1 n=1 Tax=Diversispora eburnea TaxID=1213867 RepID=A0A9N9BA50_9GLOM|nr:11661_t:CDS:2 [Diversispora eburnea]